MFYPSSVLNKGSIQAQKCWKKILHDLQAANLQSGSKILRRIINTSKITVEKKSAGSEKIR